jgi:hypothetical protein
LGASPGKQFKTPKLNQFKKKKLDPKDCASLLNYIGRINRRISPGLPQRKKRKKKKTVPILNTTKVKRTEGVWHKALSSNPSTAKKKKRRVVCTGTQ